MQLYFDEYISMRTRLFAVLGSILLLSLIIFLIRKGYLKEGYSILWFLLGVMVLFFSLFADLLFVFSHTIGVFYAPAALFIILIMNLVLISIHYSVVISKQEQKIKQLAQEIGLMKTKMQSLVRKTKK